jgi:rod shape-determining protein MreD
MKIFKNLIIILILLLLQSALVGRLDLWGIRPDISVLILLCMSHRTGASELIIYGLFIGFLQDIHTPERLGFSSFSLSVLAYLIDVGKRRVALENLPFRVLAVFIATILHDIIYLSLYAGLDINLMMTLILMDGFPGAVFTVIIAGMLMFGMELFFGGTAGAHREFAGSRK